MSDTIDPIRADEENPSGISDEEKKKVAAQIDATFVPRPKEETTLERYDKAKKVKGGFPKASDVL